MVLYYSCEPVLYLLALFKDNMIYLSQRRPAQSIYGQHMGQVSFCPHLMKNFCSIFLKKMTKKLANSRMKLVLCIQLGLFLQLRYFKTMEPRGEGSHQRQTHQIFYEKIIQSVSCALKCVFVSSRCIYAISVLYSFCFLC